ncbi:MAG: helix-turn-helix domain-containing protein [Treponema sp.]|jgi:phage repressor protein C with HTH and peptisase S24 domain|nr:helix-turn-helix domain-containing protein [Treponema sp.]
MEFTDNIDKILKTLSINQSALALKLGVSRGIISEFASGAREPSKEFLFGLSKIGISLDWFLTGEGEMLLQKQEKSLENTIKTNKNYQIPLLNQIVSCGKGANWEDKQNIKGYIDVFSLIPCLNLERLFAFSAQGNSMVGAGIKNGDYVLFDTSHDRYYRDDIYVFSLDGEVFCKQLEFDSISKKVKIYSIRVADLEKAELLTTLNAEEADFNDRFHIFGRVHSWIHPNLDD